MIDYFRARRGNFTLLLGGLVIGYVAAALRRTGPMDFDPWAVD